jgi:hypothetical protein
MTHPTMRGQAIAVFVSLVFATLLEVIYFPDLATAIYSLTGGEGGPGSSIGYFRDTYVLAGAIAFLLITGAIFWIVAGRSRRLRPTIVIACIVNMALLTASSLWYFHAVRAAGAYRG